MTVVDQPVHIVDYYPALANLAGGSFKKSKPLDGLDMWATITEGKPSPRTEVVYNVEMFRGAVRQGDWKLVWRTTLPSKLELFNLAQDPYEKNDLAQQTPDKVRELQQRIDTLGAEMAPSLLLEEVFKAVAKGARGKPPALPDNDEFYEGTD